MANLEQNQDNLVFVRTLLDVARNLNLATVAECVETPEEARLLTSEGVGFLQGHAFGRPSLQRPWGVKERRTASRPVIQAAGAFQA